jgi:hypothetical protein
VNILIAAGEVLAAVHRDLAARRHHAPALQPLCALCHWARCWRPTPATLRFLAIYLAQRACTAAWLSYAFADSISVGASGAIFGIVGGTTVLLLSSYRDNFGATGPRRVLQNMVVDCSP